MNQEIEEKFFKVKAEKSEITIEQLTHTVKTLRNKREEEKLNLELYQREYIYGENGFRKASKVIETVLFGKILPSVIFRINPENENIEIIDGQQRITSLIKFMENEFALNFEENDSAYMLNGLKFKNLSSDLKKIIWDYKIPMIKVLVENEKTVTEIFLDLNYQPIPVSNNEILISLNYGKIAKEAKRLSKLGEDGQIIFENIWKLFGEQKNRKNGKLGKLRIKDKTGGVSINVFKTMLSFIDKKIVINKEIDWIKKQITKSGENELTEYGLDKFQELTNYIYKTFEDNINSLNKEESPLFFKPKSKPEFSAVLADILYLSIYDVLDKYGFEFLEENRSLIANEFFKIKPFIVENLDNLEKLNSLKNEFVNGMGVK